MKLAKETEGATREAGRATVGGVLAHRAEFLLHGLSKMVPETVHWIRRGVSHQLLS